VQLTADRDNAFSISGRGITDFFPRTVFPPNAKNAIRGAAFKVRTVPWPTGSGDIRATFKGETVREPNKKGETRTLIIAFNSITPDKLGRYRSQILARHLQIFTRLFIEHDPIYKHYVVGCSASRKSRDLIKFRKIFSCSKDVDQVQAAGRDANGSKGR
jgi:hypothetical protein